MNYYSIDASFLTGFKIRLQSKRLLFLLFAFFSIISVKAQVTVTNPTNATPNLTATYATLAAAITAVNATTAIAGPVTITLDASNPQTAPAGGYVLNNVTVTGGSDTNRFIFDGGANTITAAVQLVQQVT